MRQVKVKPDRTSKKLAGDVEIFGLKEMQRGLRRAPAATRKAVNRGSKEVAEHVVKQMQIRARTVPHARQYALLLPTLRALGGRTPRLRLGGSAKARVTRKDRPNVGQFIYGVEFGGRKFRAQRRFTRIGSAGGISVRAGSTVQFPPHRGRKGYVIFPTITASHEYIKREYSRQIEKVLRGI